MPTSRGRGNNVRDYQVEKGHYYNTEVVSCTKYLQIFPKKREEKDAERGSNPPSQ